MRILFTFVLFATVTWIGFSSGASGGNYKQLALAIHNYEPYSREPGFSTQQSDSGHIAGHLLAPYVDPFATDDKSAEQLDRWLWDTVDEEWRLLEHWYSAAE